MSLALPILLAAVSLAAPSATLGRHKPGEVTSARITSRSSDFDRDACVVLFEGDVHVRYSDDTTMAADQLYMFLSNSNELSRVVALGNVVISNEVHMGTCAMATYRRRKGEIEMFGGKDELACLRDIGPNASELEGTRIKFWLDSEQVEVDNSRIRIENKEGVRAL